MFAKNLTILSAAAALALGAVGLISGCASNDTGQPMSNDTGMYNNRANTAGSSVNPDDSNRNYGNNPNGVNRNTAPNNGGTGTGTDNTNYNNRNGTGTGGTGSGTNGAGGNGGAGTGTGTGGTGTSTGGAGAGAGK